MDEEFELYLSAIANKTFIQGIDNLVGDLVLLTLNYALYDNITGREPGELATPHLREIRRTIYNKIIHEVENQCKRAVEREFLRAKTDPSYIPGTRYADRQCPLLLWYKEGEE